MAFASTASAPSLPSPVYSSSSVAQQLSQHCQKTAATFRRSWAGACISGCDECWLLFSSCEPLTLEAGVPAIQHEATFSPQMHSSGIFSSSSSSSLPVNSVVCCTGTRCLLSFVLPPLQLGLTAFPGSKPSWRSLPLLNFQQHFVVCTLTRCINTKTLSPQFRVLWLQAACDEVASCLWLAGPSWAATTGLLLREQPHLISSFSLPSICSWIFRQCSAAGMCSSAEALRTVS